MNRSDARDQAWEELATEYPPAEEPAAAEGDHAAEASLVPWRFEKPPREMGHLEILQWIEEALGRDLADLVFPGPATRGWYTWAVQDRSRFYSTLLAETRRAEVEAAEAAANVDVELNLQVEEITEMIEESIAAVNKEMEEAHGRGDFRRRVHAKIPGWSRRFGFRKTHRASLEDAICRVFGEIVEAAEAKTEAMP